MKSEESEAVENALPLNFVGPMPVTAALRCVTHVRFANHPHYEVDCVG